METINFSRAAPLAWLDLETMHRKSVKEQSYAGSLLPGQHHLPANYERSEGIIYGVSKHRRVMKCSGLNKQIRFQKKKKLPSQLI